VTTIDRNELIQEVRLRYFIRESIERAYGEYCDSKVEALREEYEFRDLVRGLLKEAEDKIPHHSTGINVLETLLKKIIPIIEDDYKQLTTSSDQRESYRAHIVNAVRSLLAPTNALEAGADERSLTEEKEKEDVLDEADIQMTIDDTPNDVGEEEITPIDRPPKNLGPDAYIDIDDKKSKAVADVDNFSIEGEDLTGRNFAASTVDRIEQNIIDSYGLLENDEDMENFFDFLITNLALHMDRMEEELQATLDEPTTPEYIAAKEKQVSSEDSPVEV
jgi:hypothetical protein